MERKQLEKLLFWVVILVFGVLILLKGTEMFSKNKESIDNYNQSGKEAEKFLETMK